jgi:uncharacterized protein HemX
MPLRKMLVFALAGALLVGVVGVGYARYSAQKAEARLQALRDEEIAASEAQRKMLKAQLEDNRALVAAAEAELANARTDDERASARAKRDLAREQLRKLMGRLPAVGIPMKRQTASSAEPCKCQAGDPLCSCL